MEKEIADLNYESDNFDTLYGNILNCIHYEVDQSQLKHELVVYAEKLGKDVLTKINLAHIGIEASIAYCLNRGAKLKQSSINRVDAYINKLYDTKQEIVFNWEPIVETANGKIIRAYVNCYSRIDNLKTLVINGKLDTRSLASETRKIVENFSQGKTAVVKMLVEHYKQSVVESKNDDTIKLWQKPLATILDVVMLLADNKSALKQGARGAKARKMASTVQQRDRKGEKAAAKVTYKEEDDTYGIRSIDPTLLVGSQAAVVFNSKTNHIEIYRAKNDLKLSMHGAKITNFDDTISTGRTLRKPERDLPQFARASNVRRLEVLADGINGKSWQLTGKLNRNSVIVKIL